jgi:hypothetical protein
LVNEKGGEGKLSYSLRETVTDQTETYDRDGNVVARNFAPERERPVEKLLFRRSGESETWVKHVTDQGSERVKIQVDVPDGAVCNYFISTAFQTWERICPGSKTTGNVRDLEIRSDEPGEGWIRVQSVLPP